MVSEYVVRNGWITPFKDNIPGDDWFRRFCKGNNLSLKKPQSVEIARRKACNPFTVYEYFDFLENAINDLDLAEKLECIYNLDETSFCNDPSKSKVLGQRGYSSTRTTSSPGRDNTTVLLATNARGDKVPPLIIFQGKYLGNEWCYKNDSVKTAYAVSQKGWMETSIFEKYFKNVFLPAIGNERPVLLIYDGHSTHVDLKVIELAISENVTILKLPPHSSHILQPLDVSGMKSMKDRWEEALVKWQRLHIGAKLPKSEFPRIITKIWDDMNPVILANGFKKKTGIYPLNRHVIPKEKFDPLTWSRWEQYVQRQTYEQGNYVEDVSEAVRAPFEKCVNKPLKNVPTLVKLALKTLNSQPDHKSHIL
ncbi:unnamed protein product [Parnassius apollo]|uniref:(apollo) hypothetical protein n=1 Tax=Parnassius apollo TaxID=110799 RepID=A0A8S3X331_PARAO|nr:unnamed protein product [Parnassius apollo]